MVELNQQVFDYPEFTDPHITCDLSNAFSEPQRPPANIDDFPEQNTLPYQRVSSSGMPETELRWAEQFQNQNWPPYANTATELILDPITTVTYAEGALPIALDVWYGNGSVQLAPIQMAMAAASEVPIVSSETTQMVVVKPGKGSRRRAPKKPKIARRAGPLNEHTRRKADEMRDVGACWRCRKYKKPVSVCSMFGLSFTDVLR
jgi:hypothetical protein